MQRVGGERAEGLEVFCRTAVEILESAVIGDRADARIEKLSPDSVGALEEARKGGLLRVIAEWVEGTALVRVFVVGLKPGLQRRYPETVMTECVMFLHEQNRCVTDSYLEAMTGQILRSARPKQPISIGMLSLKMQAGSTSPGSPLRSVKLLLNWL